MQCVRCGLVNPPGATRCDCGQLLDAPKENEGTGGKKPRHRRIVAFKELVRIVSKFVGGAAALIFFVAPFSFKGMIWMYVSFLVAACCSAAYIWSEPDEEPLQ